jgi:hypothetical protein
MVISFVLNYVSIFAYFIVFLRNVDGFRNAVGHTRFIRIPFYVLFYVENFVMLLVWFFMTEDQGVWWHTWGFMVAIMACPLHIVFMMLYYVFHPNTDTGVREIKFRVPCGWEQWRRALLDPDR